MDDKKVARLRELLEFRRVSNEHDSLMELMRSDIYTSQKVVIGEDGSKSYAPTRYKELASKSLSTGRYNKASKFWVDETAIIARTLQSITEESGGLIDLIEAHNFFADLQAIEIQASKGIDGKLQELARTTISETRSKAQYSGLGYDDKNKMKTMPNEGGR